MDAAQDVRRDRAPTALAALGTLAIVFSQGYTGLSFGAEGWRVAFYVASLAGFLGAVLASLAALVPLGAIPFPITSDRAARLVVASAALFAFGLLLTAALLALGAVDAIGRVNPWDFYGPSGSSTP